MRVSEMPRNDPPEIRLVFAEQERINPGKGSGPTVRSVYVIECCTGGQGSVTINGTRFPFHAGQAYVLLPGDAVRHDTISAEPREGYWCALDGASIGNYLREAGITSEAPYISPALFDQVLHWLKSLVASWNDRDSGAQLRQTACAYGLLGALLQNQPALQKDTWLDKAIGYMQTNYGEELPVEKIAGQIGLERSYFSARFRQKTGVTPHQYLTRLRVQKACQLLETTDFSISEIAYLVGLAPHNFSRIFKKETGITPQDYQQGARI